MSERKQSGGSTPKGPSDLAAGSNETVLDAKLPSLPAEALETVLNAPLPKLGAVRGGTGKMAALAPGALPKNAAPAASDTVLIDRPKVNLAVEDPPTDPRSLASDDAPTEAKRPLAGLVDDPGLEDPDKPPPEGTVLTEKAKAARGVQVIAAAFLLLVALGLGAKLVVANTRTPSRRTLLLLYPFGFSGGQLPGGRRAPGAGAVEFKLVKSFDCAGQRCLGYLAQTPDGSFQYSMTVRDDDGLWRLGGSESLGGR
jgi:hypothetical protein